VEPARLARLLGGLQHRHVALLRRSGRRRRPTLGGGRTPEGVYFDGVLAHHPGPGPLFFAAPPDALRAPSLAPAPYCPSHVLLVCELTGGWWPQHMLATGGTDKTVRVWDADPAQAAPVCVHAHDGLNAGAIFAVAWCPDEPFYLAGAGAKVHSIPPPAQPVPLPRWDAYCNSRPPASSSLTKRRPMQGKVRLWDALTATPVRRSFEGRAPAFCVRPARKLPKQISGLD
jgi:hypothetical protein